MNQRCTECNGTGGCKVCKGSGKKGYSGRGTLQDQSGCPTCYATGVCQTCGGTGGNASNTVQGEPMMGSSQQIKRT